MGKLFVLNFASTNADKCRQTLPTKVAAQIEIIAHPVGNYFRIRDNNAINDILQRMIRAN